MMRQRITIWPTKSVNRRLVTGSLNRTCLRHGQMPERNHSGYRGKLDRAKRFFVLLLLNMSKRCVIPILLISWRISTSILMPNGLLSICCVLLSHSYAPARSRSRLSYVNCMNNVLEISDNLTKLLFSRFFMHYQRPLVEHS